jgi:hypothetical protein
VAVLTVLLLPSAAIAVEPITGRQLVCHTIEEEAAASGLPATFLTRLLWMESGFRSSATSPAGAEGLAQFMPGTSAELGLADPRDPQDAIRHAARFLADLKRRFGNLGLAAAAYNAGAGRVAKWLQGERDLPLETQIFVRAVTGRRAEDWATSRSMAIFVADEATRPDCLALGGGQATLSGFAPKLDAWQARLDSQLATVSSLEILSVGTHQANLAVAFRSANPPVAGSAETFCATLRAKGAACRVFGR